MSPETIVLSAIADAFAAAETTLRERIAALNPQPSTGEIRTAVERARIMNPHLGQRQAELIGLLEEIYPEWTDTGQLHRSMGYDQANVYLTVNNLVVGWGIAEKDSSTRPHRYRLSPEFMGTT